MANKDDSVIFYISQFRQVEDLPDEELGQLYRALFNKLIKERGEEPLMEPEMTGAVRMAYRFLTNQIEIDKRKYEDIRRKRSKAGKLGGAKKGNTNAKKTSKTSKNKQNKLNDNVNDNVNVNDNDAQQQQHFSLGVYGNVNLTEDEYEDLKDSYEHVHDLIDKVSMWLRNAKGETPDHHTMCLKFAMNENWPKRKVIEPPKPIVVEDPLDPEEQEERMAEMRQRLNGALAI